MSDDELDRQWKPNNRPQSTMARSFSLALNDLFKIDNSLADLDAAVSEKKKAVSTQTSELEALEARLRATEERLKQAAGAGVNVQGKPSGRSSPRQRVPLGDTFNHKAESPTSPLATEFRTSRPNTGRQQTKEGEWTPPMPGALPPTPGASEGESDSEYVLVEARSSADIGQDGEIPPPQK